MRASLIKVTWRLTVRYGASTEVHDLPDVQALRVAVQRLRADPRVDSYTWLRVPELTLRERCPSCGHRYERPRVRSRVCRCGLTHITYRCYGCSSVEVDPPEHDGCGDIPPDQERWSTRGWTMWD